MAMESRLVAAALAICLAANSAAASGGCASPRDMAALETAAVQQRLMVAALTCGDIGRYNRFVVAYQDDLQRSDDALKDFFERQGGPAGIAGYHTFKTQMANEASLQSAREKNDYCARAREAFYEALAARDMTLDEFVSDQSVPLGADYAMCRDAERGGAMEAGTRAWPGRAVISSAKSN
jgi:hypothetical protein